jgi:hypothetical protein
MSRAGTLIGTLLFIAISGSIPLKPASAQEQAPVASAPTDASVYRRGGRMDVRHPLHIGSDYYPKQSLKNGEQGMWDPACLRAHRLLEFFRRFNSRLSILRPTKWTSGETLSSACAYHLVEASTVTSCLPDELPIDNGITLLRMLIKPV